MDKELQALKIDKNRRVEQTPSRIWLWILVGFLVGAVLAVSAFRTFFMDSEGIAKAEAAPVANTADSQIPVARQVSSPGPGEPVLIASGYIVPHHRITVGSKILGKIVWVGFEKSDHVEKGQLLVKLDDDEFRTQLDQSAAALASSRARLAELEAGTRPEEIQRAEAEVMRSRADMQNARLEFERMQSLVESKVVSTQEVDNARTRLDMAEAALAVAEKNYQLAVAGPRIEQVESARAEVERAEATVRYWETQIQETEIRAPITGTVLERNAELGQMVSTSFAGGATVVALTDLTDLQVELDISQSDFHNIDPANGCVMSPMAYRDREYKCEIAEIDPQANRQRATIQVKVQILEPDEYLRPEMDAQVTFYRPEEGDGEQ